uniref:ATP synthase complex subunit 8 n=1 Tax=Aegla aff. longirostri MHT-2018 TaxID=2070338 RepID=A0A343S8U0_9EUCA|nr:ATP synthase F0 subunit 8 [Aegla aff. longirostri MHT-2018]
MPQMAPLMWFNLMLMFLISLTIFFIVNYFNSIPSKMNKQGKSILMMEKIWKW